MSDALHKTTLVFWSRGRLSGDDLEDVISATPVTVGRVVLLEQMRVEDPGEDPAFGDDESLLLDVDESDELDDDDEDDGETEFDDDEDFDDEADADNYECGFDPDADDD